MSFLPITFALQGLHNRQKYLEALQRCEDFSIEVLGLKTQLNRQMDTQSAAALELKSELMQREISQMQHMPVELKAKQVELDELRSTLKVREQTIDALANDLEQCLSHSENLKVDIENERVANKNLLTLISSLEGSLKEHESKAKEILQQRQVTEKQNSRIIELEECLERNRTLNKQFETQLLLLREESSKQILRIKERAETQRSALNAQIGGLERELAHSRAALKATCKEKDETRSRLVICRELWENKLFIFVFFQHEAGNS